MKKSLTLMIGATLLFGSAQAAPLAQSPSLPPDVTVASGKVLNLPQLPGGEFYGVTTNKVFTPKTAATLRKQAARSAQAASNRVLADNVTIVAQSSANNFNLIPGFYKLPHFSTSSTADFETFTPSGYPPCTFNGGGVYNPETSVFGGLFLNANNNTIMYFEMSMSTGVTDMDAFYNTDLSEIGMTAMCVTRDPVSGKSYGSFRKDDGTFSVWGEVDYTNRTRTAIKDQTVPIVEIEGEYYYDFNGAEALHVLGVTRNGQFYGIRFDGTLVKIEKTTGEQEVIGATGIPLLRTEGCTGCINQRNNTLIVSEVPADASCTNLWEINLETAEKALLAKYPATFFYNMFMVPMPAAEKAPDAPVLTVNAPEGTMTANFTITMPTTLFDGTPLSAAVDWEITEGDEVLFEGRNMPGSSVSGELTITEPGMKTFVARAKNAEGYSPKAIVEIYVGKGVPAAPATLTAAFADGQMNLTWDAVTESADGGYLVPGEVTYDVSDGSILLAKDLTETSYSFEMAYPEARTLYQYTVTAKYAGRRSAEMLSNELQLGPVELPYIVDFTSEDKFLESGLTILDNNGDGNTWTYSGYAYKVNYNSSKDMDDWMFTPDVKLEAGKLYEVKVRCWGNSSSWPERIEVKYGNASTPEAMTGEVIPVTTVGWRESEKQFLVGQVVAQQTGIFHFGIHGCSQADMYTLYVDEFQIGAGIPVSAPAKPSSMELTPNSTGALSCKIEAVAPTTTAVGDAISGNLTINFKRNGEIIETTTAAAGAAISFTDYNVPVKGTYTYSVSAVNAEGEEGPAIEKDIYVGPYGLIASKRCEFFETDMPGTVTVIWDAVDKDINGNSVSSSFVTYMVYDAETMEPMLAQNTSNLRATFKALADPSQQKYCQFVVAAFNRDQEPTTRNMKVSNYAPVGKAYTLPVKYTKPESFDEHLMAVVIDDPDYCKTKFGFYDATSFDGISGQDDDSFFGFTNEKANGLGELFTGKLDLTNVERPELSFFLWKQNANDRNRLVISVIADGEEKTIEPLFYTNSLPNLGWNKLRYNLEEFAGKFVQIHMKSTPYKTPYQPHLFDNLIIKDIPAVDIEMNSITAPKKVKINQQFDITVAMTNLGYDTAKNFKVNLYRDGKIVDSQDIPSLDSEDQLTVVFENQFAHFDENSDNAVYHAEVVCSNDGDESNDRTKDFKVVRLPSQLEAVTDLEALTTDEGVKLTWTPYQLPDANEVITINEDFETQESWAQSIKGWTFLDLDGRPVGQYDYPIPGVTVRETCTSFLVWDQEEYKGSSDFDAHSGYKYLASIYCVYGEDTHDWAISPKLSDLDDDNIISFYARNVRTYGYSIFKVMATTVEGSIDPADYELISDEIKVTGTWTKFEFSLDLAYRHFAIVNVTPQAMGTLLIDDISFNALASEYASNLTGYEVYRNGVKIGETDGTGEFLDTEAGMGYHVYHVVAKYAEGYSELSNPAEIEVDNSAVTLVGADDQPTVKVDGSDIVVGNAGNLPVAISTISGQVIFNGIGDCRFTAAPAFYLVTVNNRPYKVVVR